jgi:hypothetical protein
MFRLYNRGVKTIPSNPHSIAAMLIARAPVRAVAFNFMK